MAKLKRLVRHLLGFPQAGWVYSRQGAPKYLDVYGDSDRLATRAETLDHRSDRDL